MQQQHQQRCHQHSYGLHTHVTPRGLNVTSWFEEESDLPPHRVLLPSAGVFHSYWCSGHKFHSDSLALGCQIWHPDSPNESGPRPSFKTRSAKEQHKWKQRRAIVQSHGLCVCGSERWWRHALLVHTFQQRLQGSCLKKKKKWKQQFVRKAVFSQMEKKKKNSKR